MKISLHIITDSSWNIVNSIPWCIIPQQSLTILLLCTPVVVRMVCISQSHVLANIICFNSSLTGSGTIAMVYKLGISVCKFLCKFLKMCKMYQ